DATAEIARKYKCRIFRRPNLPMLNSNKNFGFTKARGDWILNLDADEVVTYVLRQEIDRVILSGGQISGYWIPRKNIIFGKWIRHGIWWPDRQIRLFKRGRGSFPEKKIHEYLTVDGPVGELTESYDHFNYRSVSQYISTLDRCTTSEARELAEAGYSPAWHDAIRFPVSDFLKIYFAQASWRDGLHGLVLSLMQAFYALVLYAKAWENQKFPEIDPPFSSLTREMALAAGDFKFWLLSTRIERERNPVRKLYLRIRRSVLRRLKI
ncbi:hypothetical protein A2Z33_02975, partial [Candidatus Gottesmanbacteria bacterium RBG_16_52_11]